MRTDFKHIIIFLSFLTITNTLKAQTFNEWFRQKKTQIKYLTQQIAELQLYIGYVKKGYDIGKAGLNTIHSIKNGEFSLHDLYYTSLKQVNPRIRESPKAMDILSHQQYILKVTSELKKLIQESQALTTDQKNYYQDCIKRLLEDVEGTRKMLLSVTSNGDLEMTDDQRIKRIDILYDYSLSQVNFIKQFSMEIKTLIQASRAEEEDMQRLKGFYDLR